MIRVDSSSTRQIGENKTNDYLKNSIQFLYNLPESIEIHARFAMNKKL